MNLPNLSKRKVNYNFDNNPSIHHLFNFEISKKYIKDKNVLDIGCWTGQFEQFTHKIAKSIYGIDPNKFAIEFAKKKFPKLNFQVGSALKLPFPKNSFDTVVFLEVIEHLPAGTEIKALKEIKRVLKPGGILILSTPNKHFLSILLDPAYFLIKHRHYSSKEIELMLKKTTFSIINKYTTGKLVRLIWSNVEYIAKHIVNKIPKTPNFIDNTINNEYKSNGFAALHFIAKNEK